MKQRSFLTELQRRNVHRAVVFYAGAAWLLMQVITQGGPVFDLPAATQRWAITALLIGFPFAMLFSWFYEWTPQGIRLESEIERGESVTRRTGKAMDRWFIAVLSLAVVRLDPSRDPLREEPAFKQLLADDAAPPAAASAP
ncbi:hypothetical protein [Hydrocarboniphaga sp.]|uniref:hypothetical protein n=1 Tax=Hydrocarboniphaga sp. TaxID=2033016 RepID=UPI003D13122E